MNVAQLNNLHAVQSRWQIGDGNLDAADLVIQALGGKAVHGREERSGSGSSSGGAEKVPAAGIRDHFRCFGKRAGLLGVLQMRGGTLDSDSMEPAPNALQPMNSLNGQISK